jgi:cytohesin
VAVRALVPSRVPASAARADGWPLVMVAASKGHADVVAYLLAQGADPNQALPSGYTSLMQAARYGYLDTVKALVAGRADVNAGAGTRMGTALHVALADGSHFPDVTAYLVSHGARLDTRDQRGRPPLLVAADESDVEAVELSRVLLDARARAPVDLADGRGNTALAWSAMRGNAQLAALLVAAGAQVDARNEDAQTPLFQAAHGGHAAIVDMLLSHGASATPVALRDGDTALHRAANNGHADVVDLLLAKGAPVDARNRRAMTPLHMAARNGRIDAARLLLARGAAIDARDADGHTPADLATQNRQQAMVAFLTSSVNAHAPPH